MVQCYSAKHVFALRCTCRSRKSRTRNLCSSRRRRCRSGIRRSCRRRSGTASWWAAGARCRPGPPAPCAAPNRRPRATCPRWNLRGCRLRVPSGSWAHRTQHTITLALPIQFVMSFTWSFRARSNSFLFAVPHTWIEALGSKWGLDAITHTLNMKSK